jgi:hypothetical protein
MHALDKVHIASKSVHQHLEDVDLFLPLLEKDVLIHVFNCGVFFHIHDAIKDSCLAAASKQ